MRTWSFDVAAHDACTSGCLKSIEIIETFGNIWINVFQLWIQVIVDMLAAGNKWCLSFQFTWLTQSLTRFNATTCIKNHNWIEILRHSMWFFTNLFVQSDNVLLLFPVAFLYSTHIFNSNINYLLDSRCKYIISTLGTHNNDDKSRHSKSIYGSRAHNRIGITCELLFG